MQQWSLPAADTYFRPILEQDPRGFQIDHLEVALRHCKLFRTAVDGGAHIGTWSAAMARRFVRVIAFEPAHDTFVCLAQNVAAFPNVEVRRCALGEKQGHGRVNDDQTRVGNTGSRFITHAAGDQDTATDITRLDDVYVGPVDFLKLDVEGSELAALRGAKATMLRYRPVVMIEVKRLREGHDPEEAARWLVQFGYREVDRVRNDRVYTFP